MTVQRRELLAILAAGPAIAMASPALAQMLPAPAGLPAGSVEPVGDSVVGYVEVAPGSEEQAVEILKALRDASLKESGNKSFTIHQRIASPHHFGILEQWADNAAREMHLAQTHVKTARAQLGAIEIAPYDERPHRALATGPAQSPAASAFTCITHVDFVPVYREEGEQMLRMLATASRAEKDAARFDVLTQASRPNHMTLIEVWNTQSGWRDHVSAKHTKDFRLSLLPRSGSLYDERIYRAIV